MKHIAEINKLIAQEKQQQIHVPATHLHILVFCRYLEKKKEDFGCFCVNLLILSYVYKLYSLLSSTLIN